MHNAEGRLIKVSEKFRKRYFAIKRKKDVPQKEHNVPDQVLEEKDVPQISQKPQKGTIPVASEDIKISAISAISAGQKDESVPSVGSVRPNVSAGPIKGFEGINDGINVKNWQAGWGITKKVVYLQRKRCLTALRKVNEIWQ